MTMPAPEPIRIEPVKIEPAKPYERILETERVVSEALKKGNQLAAEGNVELARREYRTAAALNTSNVDAQLGLAYLCFLQEQWELSMQHYLNALQINPRSADAHYGLGRVLSELGRVNDAIPELRKALELDPTLFDAQETLTSLGQLA
jgi:tetratricopeptide (TPR) repeat protein